MMPGDTRRHQETLGRHSADTDARIPHDAHDDAQIFFADGGHGVHMNPLPLFPATGLDPSAGSARPFRYSRPGEPVLLPPLAVCTMHRKAR